MDPLHSARRLSAVAILAALATVLVHAITISTRTGQLVAALMLGGRPADQVALQDAEAVLARVSIATLLLGSGGIATLAAMQGRRWLAAVAVLAIVGANLTTQILKAFVIERSDLLDGLVYPLPNSFPSGHATAAASLAVGLILVAPPVVRAPLGFAAAIVAILFGVATITAGWHRMADAVAGACIAVAWGAGLGAFLAVRRRVDAVGARTARLARLAAVATVAIGTILNVGGLLVYLVVAIDPLDVLVDLARRGGSPVLYVLGVVLTFGTGLMAFGGLSRAIAAISLDGHSQATPTDRQVLPDRSG
jgi:membrane-associated phospholipid phosphatase